MQETYSDGRSCARLLAAATKESGASLHALAVTSLGLRMDDHTTRVAVGLRLGTPLCQTHICHHWGGHVDALATHRLSCIKSQGRFLRHAAINRSLAAVNVNHQPLSPLQAYLDQLVSDLTVVLLPQKKSGQCLVWDITCVDTFTPSYISDASSAIQIPPFCPNCN